MLQYVVQFLVTGIINIIAFVISILFYPIYFLFSRIFPDLSTYWADGLSWFNNNVINYIAFFRESFFNLTGFPRVLMNLFIGYLVAKLLLHVVITAGNFIINAYQLIKRGTTK